MLFLVSLLLSTPATDIYTLSLHDALPISLVIPGFNDDPHELREAAQFLASVSRDIPWHVTGFHKDYKMTEPEDTQARELTHAAEIGAEEGLRFVYAGNRPGQVGEWENTRCPNCRATLIERYGYLIR